MRSVSGMNDDSALSIVVLPEPVPPEIRMFSFPWTHARKNSASSFVSEPVARRAFIVILSVRHFRIVIVGLFAATGGVVTLRRHQSVTPPSTSADAPRP